MSSSAVFKPGVGVILTINGQEGQIIIPDTMLVSAMEKHLAELVDWLS